MPMTLAELLALLPDNNTGDIDAADLRTIVTELFDNTATVLAEAQANTGQIVNNDARLDALENQAPGGGGATVAGRWQINPIANDTPGGMQVSASSGVWTDATWLRFAK